MFNNLVGMANEPTIKLLDGTKQIIKNNFILQKNSGNFKSGKSNGYEKQKKSSTEGPSSVDLLKAATTIPIGILKGLATTVDPNIFLADKIVMIPSASKIVDLIYYTLRGKKPKEKENSDKNKSYLFA